MIQEATDRIRQMELLFDQLQNIEQTNPGALRQDAAIQAMLQTLTQYYESGQWLQDNEFDEKGLLPLDLKRGVLAQDGIYNFLARIEVMDTQQSTPYTRNTR